MILSPFLILLLLKYTAIVPIVKTSGMIMDTMSELLVISLI